MHGFVRIPMRAASALGAVNGTRSSSYAGIGTQQVSGAVSGRGRRKPLEDAASVPADCDPWTGGKRLSPTVVGSAAEGHTFSGLLPGDGSRLVEVPTTLELDVEHSLRGVPPRLMRSRVAVPTATAYEHPPADTDSTAGGVREELGEGSTQAVCDVRQALTAAGPVRRIEPAGPARYHEAWVEDDHHHVVRLECGAIAEVGHAVADMACLTASHDHGFPIDGAVVIDRSPCPVCSTALSPRSHPD